MSTIQETTDAAQNSSTIYTMKVGDDFLGQMSGGESDWVAISLTAGKTYSFGAVGIGAAGSGVNDPDLRLHYANGASVPGTFNADSGPGLTPSMTFTATSSGTYYIEVDSHVASGDPAGPANAAYGLTVSAGPQLSYDAVLGAAILYRDGLSWAATPATHAVVTYGFRMSGPAYDATDTLVAFHRLTSAQMVATQGALAAYSSVANITFQQVNPGGYTNNATILIGAYTSANDGAGAFAYFPGSTAASAWDGDLWLNTTSVSSTSLPLGSYSNFVLLHELGHAMGLDHPGDYDAAPGVSITYQNSAQFRQDSNQFTVMSYFDARDTQTNAPNTGPDTLMMYDIFAVQALYGANYSTNAGNSVYGFHSTVGGAFDFSVNRTPLVCIWDGGGIDTLDLSGFSKAERVDLHAGAFSDVGGYSGNLSIAIGCQIENAIGGTGADTLNGNEVSNLLAGGRGADTLCGYEGSDTLKGGAGADHFVFAEGFGTDQITDFNSTVDKLDLSATLWDSVVLTAAEVVSDFGKLVSGHVVLDFGSDELALMNVHSLTGLSTHILLV